jgi:hypothetical protein
MTASLLESMPNSLDFVLSESSFSVHPKYGPSAGPDRTVERSRRCAMAVTTMVLGDERQRDSADSACDLPS